MTLTDLGEHAAAAVRLMADAAHLARSIQAEAVAGPLTKLDLSPVTVVDFAVQAVVARGLKDTFPDDALVAEEDAQALKGADAGALLARVTDAARRVCPGLSPAALLDAIDHGAGAPGERFWTLDPIDGTRGLLRGGQYVVALALLVDGRPEVGAIGCPRLALPSGGGNTGGVAIGVRGRGSWWYTPGHPALAPLGVSAIDAPTDARFTSSVEESHSDRGRMDSVVAALAAQPPPLLMDSQAKHVMVAAGEADVLVRFPRAGYHEAIWDVAAGAIIIEEAGGRLSDLRGRVLDYSTGRRLSANAGLVATNGRLHDAVLAAISAEVPAPHGHA